MIKPVSIFIMDVSNSSYSSDFGDTLETYLEEISCLVKSWTKDVLSVKVSARRGDEIIFISENYTTAYTIAFYITRIWKFRNNKPYFGLSFGNINKNIEDINLETWIHPLVKQARIANNKLKEIKKNRPPFRFELDNNVNSTSLKELLKTDPSGNLFTVFETLINTLIDTQNLYFGRQTYLQEIISTLKLIIDKQRNIAVLLKKSPSTISNHLNKGEGTEIIKTFNNITESLNSFQITNLRLESLTSADKITAIDNQLNQQNPYEITNKLNEKIKQHLKNNISTYFDFSNI
ncbi:hypothetical protein [Paucisalibacillus globulus]|uniref:hypothetical protein n=1 Tax=Paucisalibacillus globulus TaxID=351095 RepID=UPI0003F9522A|nr:hypothetical protein [Paucisalibacillus globulus]